MREERGGGERESGGGGKWALGSRTLAVISCAIALLAASPAAVSEAIVRQLPAAILSVRRIANKKVFPYQKWIKTPTFRSVFHEIARPQVLRQMVLVRVASQLPPPAFSVSA